MMNVTDPVIADYAITYFSIYSAGLVFQFSYNSIAAVLRAIGDSKATLYFLLVSAVLNLLLDLLFVIVFKWGVVGAAVATVIAQLVCTITSAVYMVKRYEMFRYKREEFVLDKEKAKICFRLGVPMMLQQCVVSFSNVLIQRLVNSFGEATMTAFTIGVRIESYLLVTAIGFNVGMSTFTGQNMGAGRIDRIKRGWRKAELLSCGVAVFLSIIIVSLARPTAALFGVSGQALTQSVEFIRFVGSFFVLFSFYGINTALLQGAGDVLYSTFCTLGSLFFRVAGSYLLAYVFNVGYASAWISMPIGWALAAAVAFPRYLSGKWKTKGIAKLPREEATALS